MKLDSDQQAFFAFVQAGLWEKDVRLSSFKDVDFHKVYILAEKQSVIGLLAAGIEYVHDVKVPQDVALTFASSVLQLEQRNMAMNGFVTKLIETLREDDIYALLVKGQGVAQCYERPLWRTPGDVDLLLSKESIEKAKKYFDSISISSDQVSVKDIRRAHYEFRVGEWIVELHGSMHSDLSRRVDNVIDEVQNDLFYGGNVRSWNNNGTNIFLPSPDIDVLLIFTHILQHLFLEGVGLRQICDWCRLLWTFRESIDQELLKSRIQKMGLMTEWNVISAFAVKYLGMELDSIPLYDSSKDWGRKADRLCSFVLKVGNFGHNRDVVWSNAFKRRLTLIWHKVVDTFRLSFVFPLDASKFFINYAFMV